MADTTDFNDISVSADAATDSLEAFSQSNIDAGQSLNTLNDFINTTGSALKNLTSGLKAASDAQRNGHLIMQQSANLLGVIGSAALGASKTFDSMKDISGINSFKDQIDVLAETASRSAGGLLALANAFHMPLIDKAGKAIELTAATVTRFVKATLEGPDAALRFQNSFLEMSAAGGNLDKVFTQTGGNLQNLNALLQTQGQMLAKAAEATNTDSKVTAEYYTALGKIPGFLNAQLTATDESGHSINMLTAAMKLAHGTGQDQSAVIQELTQAYNSYGVSGEKALEFTARISELSQKYNVQLSDTQEYMNRTADAFKFLGENINSSASMFENYFSRLKETGLSTKAVTEINVGMANSIASMTIAQKAFLSSRTGGVGGLQGAIQIEKDIREGKMGDVMQKVESALKQQFGKIVTQQEATTSQQAAAQFVKQRMFLQQGPFGQLVGGGAEGEAKATRLLEAFAKPGGVSQVDAQKILRDDIKRGSEVEQKSYTQFTQMNARLEAIKMLSGITALGVTQRALTPAAGGDLQKQLMGGIRDAIQGGRDATTAGNKTAQDRSALYMTQGVKGVYDVIDHLGTSVHAIGKEATSLVSSKEAMQRQQTAAYNNTREEVHRAASVKTAATTATTAHHPNIAMMDKWMTASDTKRKTAPPEPQHITVTMNSVCPDCHKKFVSNQQQTSINNAPGQFGPGF